MGEGVLLSRKVGEVGETARSKIERGDAGRSGAARGKSVLAAKRGNGGER